MQEFKNTAKCYTKKVYGRIFSEDMNFFTRKVVREPYNANDIFIDKNVVTRVLQEPNTVFPEEH